MKPRHRTVTIRMPAELHRSLLDEAYVSRTSMNRMCVEALADFVRRRQIADRICDAAEAELARRKSLAIAAAACGESTPIELFD